MESIRQDVPSRGTARAWRPAAMGRQIEPPVDSAVPFWALVMFTVILLMAPQTFFPALAPLRLALLTAGLTVTTYLFERFVHHRPFFQFKREIVIALCLLGWTVVTLPFSYW